MGKKGGQKTKKVFRKLDLSEVAPPRDLLQLSQDARQSNREDSSYSSRSRWNNSRDNSDSNNQSSNSSWRDDKLERYGRENSSSQSSTTNWRSASNSTYKPPSSSWGRRNPRDNDEEIASKNEDENSEVKTGDTNLDEEPQPSSKSCCEESNTNETEAVCLTYKPPSSREAADRDSGRPYSGRSGFNSSNYGNDNYSKSKRYEDNGGSSTWRSAGNSGRGSESSYGKDSFMNRDRRDNYNRRTNDRAPERNDSEEFSQNRYNGRGRQWPKSDDSVNENNWRQQGKSTSNE